MPWLLGLFNRCTLIGLAIAVTLAAAGYMVLAYGASRYDDGVAKERAAWEDRLAEWEEKSRLAQEALTRANAERDAAIAERDQIRRRLLAQTEMEIENAPDIEGRYSAYLAFRNGLRQRRTERHFRARADYLSSIAPDPNPGPSGNRSEFRFLSERSQSALCLEAR